MAKTQAPRLTGLMLREDEQYELARCARRSVPAQRFDVLVAGMRAATAAGVEAVRVVAAAWRGFCAHERKIQKTEQRGQGQKWRNPVRHDALSPNDG